MDPNLHGVGGLSGTTSVVPKRPADRNALTFASYCIPIIGIRPDVYSARHRGVWRTLSNRVQTVCRPYLRPNNSCI
ncbi:hypothetical protein WOLCODRAFT_28846 [Wolfiporia cocos MD-104 SS10]|uniref:Uncharacterized protein n=1 Tax=Wolfiporia cocos (strain MD-104) TaxID=742152 RepID=A0A2H3JJW4_WOLCO|nr:hypothetical protein WOLCODRAFT_28846 [Wolfiporia cocos MD-104 SS10]